MSEEAVFDFFRNDQILCKYIEYFKTLNRNPDSFLTDSEKYYSDVSKREVPIIWLCDRSGFHSEIFIRTIVRYENAFAFLEKNGEMALPCPICECPKNKKLDFIFGEIKEISVFRINDYRKKYEQWKNKTIAGLIKKIDYILDNPFRNVTGVRGDLNRKYKAYLHFIKKRLLICDDEEKIPIFSEFKIEE